MTLLALLLSYLLGSIPNGLWLCRALWHVDLRQHGSHNIGATNAWRTLGKGPGFLVFFLDMRKGLLAVWRGEMLVGTPLVMILCGVLAIVGHSLSLFLRFHGGKGVATGRGVILMRMPKVTVSVFLVWRLLGLATRDVSRGSIVAAARLPVLALVLGYPARYAVFGVLAAALIIVRHRSNITRLLNGTENRISAGHL